jgi:hypothetical protein
MALSLDKLKNARIAVLLCQILYRLRRNEEGLMDVDVCQICASDGLARTSPGWGAYIGPHTPNLSRPRVIGGRCRTQCLLPR